MKPIAVAASLLLVSAPAYAAPSQPKPVELSGPALSAAQTRTYPTTFDKAFPAAVSALQTMGYLNINASRDAGTITAETSAKAKVIYNVFWGLGKKKRTQLASLLIEELTPGQTVVRLNLSMNEAKSRGPWGTSFQDGKLITFAEPYADFFQTLDAEIARRTAVMPASQP